MIAYFDTSALVPLLVDEPGTEQCREHWQRADRLVTVRLAYVETRAALAQAARIGGISPAHLRGAVRGLDELLSQAESVDVDDELVRRAGSLAQSRSLRAYDAVHLAAADRVRGPDLVVVAGDAALLNAATSEGMAIASVG